MLMFKVIEPGMMSTFQDHGRHGHEHLGLPSGGVLCYEDYVIANALVGQKNASILEMTGTGPVLKFYKTLKIAVTGAMQPIINDVVHPIYETILIKKGDILSFQLRKGLRGVLAFSDDLVLGKAFDSSSTSIKLGLGGFNGRRLLKDDEIECNDQYFNQLLRYKKNTRCDCCRVILGLEAHLFKIEDLFKEPYQVSQHADRMGIRLKGIPLTTTDHDIISAPIVPGTIQIPPDSQPIVLMQDAQTIGGYTRIGKVIQNDLHILAQAKPGDTIQFKSVSLKDGKVLYREWVNALDNIASQLVSIRTYYISISNQTYYVTMEA